MSSGLVRGWISDRVKKRANEAIRISAEKLRLFTLGQMPGLTTHTR